MNRTTYWFCRIISYLDVFPRYGRLYTIGKDELVDSKWVWQRYGYWGLRILDNMDLLWKYIEYDNPDIREWLNKFDENN